MPTPDSTAAGADAPAVFPGPVALLGDAHLHDNDPEVGAFVHFLDTLPADIRVLGILGDLFAAWIGRRDLTRPQHVEVLAALRRLRSRGCRILYVEGNHDLFLSRLYDGDPFDRLDDVAIDCELAGRRVHLAHGDLVNSRDRQYLAWRALCKNRLFFTTFNLLPAGLRQRLVDRVEDSLDRTNLEFRESFPDVECEKYARARIRAGVAILVFGHFHQELRFDYREGDRTGSVFVLPAWRAGHRYLRIAPGSEPVFVSS